MLGGEAASSSPDGTVFGPKGWGALWAPRPQLASPVEAATTTVAAAAFRNRALAFLPAIWRHNRCKRQSDDEAGTAARVIGDVDAPVVRLHVLGYERQAEPCT